MTKSPSLDAAKLRANTRCRDKEGAGWDAGSGAGAGLLRSSTGCVHMIMARRTPLRAHLVKNSEAAELALHRLLRLQQILAAAV